MKQKMWVRVTNKSQLSLGDKIVICAGYNHGGQGEKNHVAVIGPTIDGDPSFSPQMLNAAYVMDSRVRDWKICKQTEVEVTKGQKLRVEFEVEVHNFQRLTEMVNVTGLRDNSRSCSGMFLDKATRIELLESPETDDERHQRELEEKYSKIMESAAELKAQIDAGKK